MNETTHDDAVAAAINAEVEDSARAARLGYTVTVGADSDYQAELRKVARKTGLPIQTVINNPQEAKRQAAADDLDFSALAQTSPHTAALLADVDMAAVARDDVEQMGKLEGLVRSSGRFIKHSGQALATAIPRFNKGAYGLLRSGAEMLPGSIGAPVADFAAEQAAANQATIDRWMPRSTNQYEQAWMSGMASTGTMALNAAAAAATGQPTLLLMGLGTAGDAYQDAREKGVGVGQSAAFAAGQGMVEAGTEMISFGALKSMINPSTAFGKKALEYILKEQGGEQIATHLQDLNEWAVLHPEKTLEDYFRERPNAAFQTALSTAFASGTQAGVIRSVQIAANLYQGKQQQAEQAAQLVQGIHQVAAASKVAQRSPEDFAAFAQAVADEGESSTFYIDANVLLQSGIAEQVAALSPAVAEQLQEAAQTGGQIAIPAGEYIAHLARSEFAGQLVEHIKTEPDAWSKAEAREWMQSGEGSALQREMDYLLREKQADETFRASSDAVRDTIKSQLAATGRFSAQAHDSYAALTSSFYAVQAAKMGVTPEELYRQYPLRVMAGDAAQNGYAQALASHPPKGWTHVTDSTAAVGLWNGSDASQAVFWTNTYSSKVAAEIPELAGTSFSISKSAIEHIRKRHGDAALEAKRGQIGITEADIARIPEIVNEYDAVRTDLVSEQGSQRMLFAKKFEGGTIVYLAQLSRKRQDLQGVSMWKYPPSIDEQRALEVAVTSNQTSETNGGISEDNTSTYAQAGQEESAETAFRAPEVRNEQGELLAPNGAVSNLDERQWHQVRSPQFKAWFGDWEHDPENASKVVDENGEPLVVYRADKDAFNAFNRKKAKEGFFFTSSKERAARYGGQVRDFFLNMRNALEVERALPNEKNALDIEAEEHDGVINIGAYGNSNEYIAAASTQIKSATDNSGAFDGENPNILYQSAWHGTPHRGIEQTGFKLNKIGTGEGAQAYGWGMYFASRRGVAESYRETLGARNAPPEVSDLVLRRNAIRGDVDAQRRKIERGGQWERRRADGTLWGVSITQKPVEDGWVFKEDSASQKRYARSKLKKLEAELAQVEERLAEVSSLIGQLYQVEIPEDDDLLDYDKPLSEQPQKVRDAIEAIRRGLPREMGWIFDGVDGSVQGKQLYGLMGEVAAELNPDGVDNIQQAASELLLEHGIPGLRYLDGMSRNAGEGSHNYVIWDEALLTPEAAQIRAYYQRQQQAAAMNQAKEQLASLVDRFVQGDVDATATHEILPTSTASMRMLGLPDLPVRIGSHALDALYNHGVTPAQMKQLIDELDNPRMVMIWNRGRGGEMSLNFVTSMRNARGEPFVIGMKPNRGAVEGRHHWVATVTEKQPRAILDMVRDGGALYVGDGEIAGVSSKELRDALRFAKEKRGRESRELKAVMASSHKLSHLVDRVLYAKDLELFKNGGGYEQAKQEITRGFFDPTSNTIGLLKDADLSTFLHEAGHFFLEMQVDLASRVQQEATLFGADTNTEGQAQIARDMQILLDWFGVRDLAEWHNMDMEQKRSYHEQFARGFEAYLYEGKAPSIELQGLFRRFSAWLVKVYRELRNLNVELSDEVRGVFDRMLASSEQIALAEQGRSMMPMFDSAQEAGMTPQEFAEYQALGMQATAEAIEKLRTRGLRDMQWLRNARSRELKRLQKESRALRAEMRMQAAREVMRQPVYRAWQFLTGRMTAEDRIAPMDKGGATVGLDESRDSLLVAVAKLGGLNRDEVSAAWGIDPKERIEAPVFGKPVLRKTRGLSIDAMGEALAERGYLRLDEHGQFDPRDLEEAFLGELRGEPHYSIAYDYSRQEQRAGDQVPNPAALAAGRIDLGELAAMGLPAPVVETIKARRMTAANGLHPDIVADLFGFDSGDALVRALAASEAPNDAIDGLTDAMMLEQHGDMATPEAVERAADDAIHNAARMRFTATEANALAQAVGRRGVLVGAAREYAHALIGRQLVRNVRPSQYAHAEARAARAADKARRAGKLDVAAAEKRNQLIQQQAARAAHDARAEVDAGLRYLAKFDGDIKGLDADYAEQIHGLLERFDLRKGQSLKAIDRRKSLAEWIAAQREAGLEPDIAPELENEALRQSYKDMTVDDFRALLDAVKQIEHLGRLKHRLLTADKQRNYEAVRDEVAAGIRKHAHGRTANTRTPVTALGRALKGLKNFGAAHIKAASWARIMDGGLDGGPVWEYFIRQANARGDMETTMRAEATQKLSAILTPVIKLGKMGGKGVWFESISRSLNREERLAIALNMGNEGNMQRLLGGEGWTVQQIMPVLQSLTATEWRAVQGVWDHFESYREQIAAKEKRVYGKEPQWVEPRPFTVTTADGQTVEMRGGYYPIKYDPSASMRAENHDDAEAAKRQMQGAYTSATTRRSFTKSRVAEVQGRPLLYSLAGVYSGVNDVIHDLAWHEWLIDTNRLLKSHTIDAAIREHYGPEVKQQFKQWVQDIAEGDRGASDAVERALGRIRQSVSVAGLGFNVVSAAMQPLGLTQSVVRIGAKWVGVGIGKYIAHPFALTKRVNGMSAFMGSRARTRFRELNELRNQVQQTSAVKEWMGRNAYVLMMRFQQAVDVPTWWGAYEKALAEGNEEARAIALADQAVIDAQGGGQTKDLSAVERGGAYQKLFTTFYSFMNTTLNLGVERTMSAHTPAQKAKLAVDYLMLFVLPAVLGELLRAGITPGDSDDFEDPEKTAKALIKAQISYLMGLMVVVREASVLADMVGDGPSFGYQGPGGLRPIADATKFAQQAKQGEFDEAFARSAINLAGSTMGLPSAQINRTVKGYNALADGETENPAALVFGYQEPR